MCDGAGRDWIVDFNDDFLGFLIVVGINCGFIFRMCRVIFYTGFEGVNMARSPRTRRYEAHLLPEQKKRIELAARYEGLSVVDFMVKYADEAATRTIQWHTSWALEARDRDVFVKALFNHQEPIDHQETTPDSILEPAEKW